MNGVDRSGVIPLAAARKLIPGPASEHSATVLRRGTLNLKLSLPVPPNRQTPHSQDELYVIISGQGILWHDGKRDRFTTGDVMFIAAGTEHHFEEFTDDLAVWVVFYGAEGGEGPSGALA
jgi:mannose-6-phosphate isomerase-like protein (cupin superfamily)